MENTHCYVGFLPCGCWDCVVVDSNKCPANTASAVSDFIKDGRKVERKLISFPRENDMGCTCNKTPELGI